MRSLLHDAEYWRNRAEEARQVAAQMKNPESMRTMLEIAVSYDACGTANAREKARPQDSAQRGIGNKHAGCLEGRALLVYRAAVEARCRGPYCSFQKSGYAP